MMMTSNDGTNASDPTPLSAEEIEGFRRRLADKRAEVLGDLVDLRDEAAAERGGGTPRVSDHLAEPAASSFNEDMLRRLAENDRDLVLEIDRALARIDDGSYGYCETTGRPISRERLEAKPWARRTIDAARRAEGGSIAADDDL